MEHHFKSMYFRYLSGLLIFVAVISPRLAYASFFPGETLDPPCFPTDPTCVVVDNTSSDIIPTADGTLDIGTSTARFRNARLSGTLTATSASTTNLSTSNLWIGSITGILRAVAGAVSTVLVNLTGDVTGVLPVGNGGTGWANLTSGAILYGNGSGALSTTTAGSAGNILALLNGVPTWTASTTFSSPLSYSGGTVSIPVATASTNGYLSSSDWTTFNGKFATTSTDFWLTTKSTSNLPEGLNLYFTTNRVASVIAGTTTDALTQGVVNKYYATNLFATDLAGTTTSALAEGVNKYYTDTRVGSYISGSSTVPHIGGTAFGDMFSWTGSTWTTRATSTLGVALSDTAGTLAVSHGGTASTTLGGILTGNGTGVVTSAIVSGPLSFSANTLSISQGNASTNGYLSSTDWTTFNNKVSSSSLSAIFPLAYNSATGVFSSLFSTTTANSFNALQTFGAGYIDNASSTHTAFTQFANASTTQFTNTGSTWFTNLASAVLAVDNNGKLIATSSIGTNLLTGILGVANGGTGASSFNQGWLFSTGDGNALAASTSPTVNYITATSTTATSTFANGVNITGGCFAINGACIGIITKLSSIYATSSAGTTTVNFTGAANSNPSFALPGTLTVQGNIAYYIVEGWGGGGGGGATATNNGTNASSTCYEQGAVACGTIALINAGGGSGGTLGNNAGSGGAGGAASLGALKINGQDGIAGSTGAGNTQSGGDSPRGGTGAYGPSTVSTAGNAGVGPGGGGSGARGGSGTAGGGGGAYSKNVASSSVLTSSTFVVGSGGAGGVAGTNAGGAGATGGIVISIYATSSPSAAGNDYAEMFPVGSPVISAGDIVSVDRGIPIQMKLAIAGDTTLAGVISTSPGHVLGDQNATGQRPVALSGRVPVKVNLEGGQIKIGDRIAISSSPGIGKKAEIFDDSVGIAIAEYDGTSSDNAVMTFLNLQKGININAVAIGLLNSSVFGNLLPEFMSASSTSPVDFVGGIMNAIGSRIAILVNVATSSNANTTITTATSSSGAIMDSYASGFMQNIFAGIKNWFADTANGVGEFFAKKIHTEQLCVKKSDGIEVCVNGDQLQTVLAHDGNTDRFPVSAPLEPPATPAAGDATTTTRSTETSSSSSTAPTVVDPAPITQPIESTTTAPSNAPPASSDAASNTTP